MCFYRCAFCDIIVDISSFVNRNPMELHRVKSPACPLVTGTADNTSLQQWGQISGRHFNQLFFGATSEHEIPPLSAASATEQEHEERSASQGRRAGTDRFPTSLTGPNLSGGVSQPCSPALSAPDGHSRTAEPTQPPAHPPEPIRIQAPDPASQLQPAEPITSQAPGPALPPQPSEPTRAQTTGNALPNQTARPVGTHRQEVASSSRTTETLGRNTTNQSGSNSNIASATAPAAPAPQSPPPSTTEPPRQLVTYSQLGIYTQEPKRHDFAIATTRMNTYTGWPHSSTHTPEDMAEEGFYYVGKHCCFVCSSP